MDSSNVVVHRGRKLNPGSLRMRRINSVSLTQCFLISTERTDGISKADWEVSDSFSVVLCTNQTPLPIADHVLFISKFSPNGRESVVKADSADAFRTALESVGWGVSPGVSNSELGGIRGFDTLPRTPDYCYSYSLGLSMHDEELPSRHSRGLGTLDWAHQANTAIFQA